MTVLSITDNEISHSVITYPNPVEDVLNISASISPLSVAIYDLNGKKQEVSCDENLHSFDVTALSVGVYMLIIESEEGIFSKKFIKN